MIPSITSAATQTMMIISVIPIDHFCGTSVASPDLEASAVTPAKATLSLKNSFKQFSQILKIKELLSYFIPFHAAKDYQHTCLLTVCNSYHEYATTCVAGVCSRLCSAYIYISSTHSMFVWTI